MNIYRIYHVTGNAGYEKYDLVTTGIETEDQVAALREGLPAEASNWPIRQWGDDTENFIAANPEYDWHGCHYSDFYFAEADEQE